MIKNLKNKIEETIQKNYEIIDRIRIKRHYKYKLKCKDENCDLITEIRVDSSVFKNKEIYICKNINCKNCKYNTEKSYDSINEILTDKGIKFFLSRNEYFQYLRKIKEKKILFECLKFNNCNRFKLGYTNQFQARLSEILNQKYKYCYWCDSNIVLDTETKMKMCIICKENKTIDQFNKNKTLKYGVHCYCKVCTRKKMKEIYNKIKFFIANLKMNEFCVDCENFFPYVAMEYDHVDPKTKTNAVSNLVSNRSLKNALNEIEKCELVCRCCHDIRSHSKKSNNNITRQKIADQINEYKNKPCLICNQKFFPFQMSFDHRQNEDKITEISIMVRYGINFIDDIKKEIQKCDLLCNNCHAIITQVRKNNETYEEFMGKYIATRTYFIYRLFGEEKYNLFLQTFFL